MIVTLRAVADAAGVHPATASRALNSGTSHLVTELTRARVIEAAARLEYRPDVAAAALRSGRSRLVGILVPGLSNPVFAPIIAGAAEVLEQAGIGAMVGDCGAQRQRSADLVHDLAARRVDGLLLATAMEDRDAGVEIAQRRRIPTILINRSLPGHIAVQPDNQAGIGLAVAHLAGLGHRRIGYIGGFLNSPLPSERRDAFCIAMAAHGLTPGPVSQIPGYGREAGRDQALELLAQHPAVTGVICGNDMIAVGVYDAARLAGRRVPEDISVTGHNDIPFMDALAPPLTTVRVDYHALGATAARLLLERIAGRAVSNTNMPATLVLRGSTAPPRA